MARGDSADILRRLKGVFPPKWAAYAAPIRDVVFGGISDSLAWLYAQQQTVKAGTRRAGTKGYLLDIDAWGFFGNWFLRRKGETDDSWRKRYTDEIFRERVTRQAIKAALSDLTGRTPDLYEPWNPHDCGAIGVGTIGIAGQGYAPSSASGIGVPASGGFGEGHLHIGTPAAPTGVSFGGAGCIGSTALPFQIFITAYRPAGRGIPNVTGVGFGGIGSGSLQIVDDTQIEAVVSDAEIYATAARNTGAGIVPWTAIKTAS